MIFMIKPLIVNITILLSLTFNANLFFPFRDRLTLTMRQQAIYGLFAAFAAMLCMFYPIETLGETHFDFRMIVILIVTLYIGWPAGGICTLIVVITRLIIGGSFAGIGVLVSVLSFITAWLFRPFYWKAKNKLWHALMIVMLYFLFYFTIIVQTVSFLNWEFYSTYFAMFLATYLLMIVLIERLIVYNRQFDEMVYMDKLTMVSEMAASFAHEIRNPITTVRGFVQLLQKDAGNSQLEQFAPLILEELDRANKIITDYLKLAKPADFRLQPIDLSEVLRDCVDLLRPLGAFANVSIEWENIEKCYVWGDEQYLKQSFLNIIKNAIEAIDNGSGSVFITTQSLMQQKTVKVVIEDNGKGMTEEELKKIGLPYYTTKSKGTGLGSMISNRLIREMGGTVHYMSHPGKGTRVEITLPLMK
ncbi:two-component sensor histidine kinase [Anoxybacillus sp. UARK-01]|uniref:ATP-binding protein n=1 Tax=Anoxybacillus sp. UARK-01 TaxID=1895648 RepID=UPI0009BB46B8|nr:ATP-binding protein [Anoxybacillus sp. UARK-01]OQM46393.1 two-component sensor histidine kinase [Anoxybacillus sp. UARK-01]